MMQTDQVVRLAVGLLAGAGLLACAEATQSACGDGEAVRVDGSDYCVYRESLVIVGGFDCPASLPFRIDFEHATVCGDHGFDGIDVPEDICARAFVPCTEPEPAPDGGMVCDEGFGDCNGDSTDGCEMLLNTVTDCGACGAACSLPNASSGCDYRQCALLACNAGYGDCDLEPNNGCEMALNTLTNCGGCNVPCTGEGASCETGTCELACTGAFDCTQIDCSDYSAPASPPSECADGYEVTEGGCGLMRFREVSGGYAGWTLYWDEATGQLLAARMWSDTPAFCEDTAFSMVQGDPLVPAACDLDMGTPIDLCAQ